MAKTSTIRPVSLGGSLLTLVPLAGLVGLGLLAGLPPRDAVLTAALLFLLYRWVLVRRVLLSDHRAGILAMRAGRFEDGLRAFEKSEAFFARHRWLDRWRAPVLGSASAWGFEVLARYNQAYALSRLGRGEEALEAASALLEAHPGVVPAQELRDVLLAGSRLHPEVGAAMDDDESSSAQGEGARAG